MWDILLVFFILMLASVVILELLAWLLFRFGRYPNGIAHHYEEFPVVHDALLEKFTTWDKELGWAPQPNQRKRDNTFGSDSKRDHVYFSTDHRGGRQSFVPASPNKTISCFGDSFCFCREVNDHETWPWLLGEQINSLIYNFGVGNYGLDQAIIRMESVESTKPSDLVIMAVTSVTSERVQSVYKHFIDFGNILGVKSRFICNSTGGLDLLPSPLSSKEDLKDLERWRSEITSNDLNYPHFLKKRASFPYLISFFRCGSSVEMSMHILNKLQNLLVPKRYRCLFDVRRRLEHASVLYAARCWRNQAELIIRLIERFEETARRGGSVAIFLLQHHKRWVKYCRDQGERPYAEVLKLAAARCPNVLIVDSMDWLLEFKNSELDNLYSVGGSHHSPAGNELIAQKLRMVLHKVGV